MQVKVKVKRYNTTDNSCSMSSSSANSANGSSGSSGHSGGK